MKKFQVKDVIDAQPTNGSWLRISMILVVVLLFSAWFWSLPLLALLLFAVLFFGGKLWFLSVMFREMGAGALLIFIIPFFDWLFLFKRFDVAWKPVLLQFIGLFCLAVGFAIEGTSL